jgi:very-short-patch-repair endonuclease
LRDRAARLFDFLRALAELRMVTVRSVDEYESVLWFHKVPEAPGIVHPARASATQGNERDVWLEIHKPDLQPYPPPIARLAPWLNPAELRASSGDDVPTLRDHIVIPNDGGQQKTISLSEAPEIRDLYQDYVDHKWLPWAEEDRRRQAVQEVYTQLFSIYKRQQQLGEQYELIAGFGLLTLRTPSGLEIRRHLVTALPSVSFDASRGILTVGPGAEGARARLEQDMLDVPQRPPAADTADIERLVAAAGDAVWTNTVPDLLRRWVHAASPRGRYDASLEPPRHYTDDPVVHFAPALILRKRQERSLVRMFTDIAAEVRKGGMIPLGVRRLVSIEDDRAAHPDGADGNESGNGTTPAETYFPLPANDAQREILAQLAARQGLLVQGPPGTGKSHTIANLIAHLLANGQRVLVTSHTARALRSLQEKIPAAIAPLCVLLLGEDLKAKQALEDSVRGITDRHNRWNPAENSREIEHAEGRLHEARSTEARVMTTLRDLRELETRTHRLPYGDYVGTGQTIAAQLRREESYYSWLRPLVAADVEVPLSNAEAVTLGTLLRMFSQADERELQQHAVSSEDVVSPDAFDEMLDREAEARGAYDGSAADRTHPAYSTIAAMPEERRRTLRNGLGELLDASRRLGQSGQAWLRMATEQVLSGQRLVWEELEAGTRRELDAIDAIVRDVAPWTVSGLGERDLNMVRAQTAALLEHLEAGKGLGVWPFRPKVVRDGLYLLKEVRVNGRPAQNRDVLRDLLNWVRVSQSLSVLGQRWSAYQESPRGSFDLVAAGYRDLLGLATAVIQLGAQVDRLKALCDGARLPEPRWQVTVDLEQLSAALAAADLDATLRATQSWFGALEEKLARAARHEDCHPIVLELTAAARDKTRYRRAHRQLQMLLGRRAALHQRNALLDRVSAAAPLLVPCLLSTREDPAWDERLRTLNEAWAWVRADHWLATLSDPTALTRAGEEAQHARRMILSVLGELAAAKAWSHCLSGLNEGQRQHLKAWQNAVRRYGKGKGKHAATHLRDAQEHMEACRSAIPAWVMPLYKVAETVLPGTDKFDVVIVDEASQSGPEALFLNYLATKIIVVGDEQQISPETIGIRHDDVNQLRDQYLSDIPHNDAIGVDTSFFSLSEIRYSGHVRLLEHFRCMPEIIQFSNNLCYSSNPLIPLRQYGTDRLTPVVVAQRVPHGYVKGAPGRLVNPVEADAIVEKIAELCTLPRYDGKTMGVISLLGEDQAKLIERLLIDKIGPEEMERRRLVCGDAYAFQGDERHVMFLSMVSAVSDEVRIGTLSRDSDKRRFNVAASRAQDQMWLFHSVDREDLSPLCMRQRLLDYCLTPHVEPTALPGLNIGELRTLASAADWRHLPPPPPFDSWFEVDVFLKLIERKYRVLPQFQVGSRRIDLVVEGLRGRLAVECDGDEWHGAEQFELDMSRQRDLERCGWTFWRVRGSTYYRDPDAALAGLWETLDRSSIFPEGRQGGLAQGIGQPPSAPRGAEPFTVGLASQESVFPLSEHKEKSDADETQPQQDIDASARIGVVVDQVPLLRQTELA